MYKSPDYEYEQLSFVNFNTTCGLQLDPNNEWVMISRKLPWRAWETLYEVMFPSNTGNVAKPCRMVLGSLIIQLRMGYTDRDLVGSDLSEPILSVFHWVTCIPASSAFCPDVACRMAQASGPGVCYEGK